MNYTLADVLTISHGYLLISVGRLYEVLNSMTGKDLFTHQLPPAIDVMKPIILKLYPQLKNITVPAINTQKQVNDWLDTVTPIYGNSFYVPRVENISEVDLDELLLNFIANGGEVITIDLGDSSNG